MDGTLSRIAPACLLLALCGAASGDLISDAKQAFAQGDYARAEQAARRAAEQGDVQGQYMLGSMYFLGRGVGRDYAQALRWFRKAAQQGDPESQFSLATMYLQGRGARQNPAQAEAWYLKAASQGHVTAQLQLGLLYASARNNMEAYKWFFLAAKNGDMEAMKQLEKLEPRMTQEEISDAQYRANLFRKAVKPQN